MWLPKDERVLLAHYYKQIAQPNIEQHFRNSQLVNLLPLKKLWEKIENLCKKQRKGFQQFIQEQSLSGERINRLTIANSTLAERNLIKLTPHQHGLDVIVVSLNLVGYDLGRKYNSWWSSSNLWYEEHIKNHWIWLIVSFFGGVISVLLVNWLSKIFSGTQQ